MAWPDAFHLPRRRQQHGKYMPRSGSFSGALQVLRGVGETESRSPSQQVKARATLHIAGELRSNLHVSKRCQKISGSVARRMPMAFCETRHFEKDNINAFQAPLGVSTVATWSSSTSMANLEALMTRRLGGRPPFLNRPEQGHESELKKVQKPAIARGSTHALHT